MFHSTVSRFRVTGHFDPKIALNIKRSKVAHIHVATMSSPNFTPFRSTANHFRVTGRSETMHQMAPKSHSTIKCAKVPHIQVTTTTEFPNFSLFPSMASRFPDTGHFEPTAPNDPKTTLNTKRLKAPNVRTTTNTKFQISFCFTLLPAVFELQPI